MDKITVTYTGTEKAEKVFADNADMIGTETLAVSVQKAEPAGYVKEWKINGENVTLGVAKIVKGLGIYEFKKLVRQNLKTDVMDNCRRLFRKELDEATPQEQYQSVSYAVKDMIVENWIATQKQLTKDDPKIVYYMSMEFLMGRALGNNLINMTAYEDVKEALDELGNSI